MAALLAACGSSSSAPDEESPAWTPVATLQASDALVAPVKASMTAAGVATVAWGACANTVNLLCRVRAARNVRGNLQWTVPADAPRDSSTTLAFPVAAVPFGTVSTIAWFAVGPSGMASLLSADFDGAWSASAALPAVAPSLAFTHTMFTMDGGAALWIEQQGVGSGVSGARRATAGGWSPVWIVDPGAPIAVPNDPSLSLAADGDELMAVWTRVEIGAPAGSPARVFARRLPAGAASGTTPVAIDTPVGAASGARIVRSAPGVYVALWSKGDDGNPFGGRRIEASVYSAGTWQATPALVSDSSRRDAGLIDAAAEPAGGIRAVWVQTDRDDGVGYTVWTSRFDGTTWEPAAAIVASSPDTERTYPRIGIDGTGRAHVAWYTYSVSRQVFAIEYVTRAPGDGSWSTPVILSDLRVEPGEPAFAVNASGEVVVGWLSVDSQRTSIYARTLRR